GRGRWSLSHSRRTARAIGLAIGGRAEGPVFLAADGRRLDRHSAGRIVRRIVGLAAEPRQFRLRAGLRAAASAVCAVVAHGV
ncbi:MAG TPA: hypothetical protein VMH35_14290, partial [Streptosporangiaceae bacterium]|nr:hypothetical protein [Streptosporangiaceae bacterium]